MHRTVRLTLLSTASLLAIAAAAPLRSQVAPAPASPAEEAELVELEKLTVTGFREKGYVPKHSAAGTKTVTSLLAAPQSISVVTSDQMTIQGAQGIEDALRYSSGVAGGSYGSDPRSDWVYIRGFQPTRYLDGLALPEGSWNGLTRLEPYGAERLEVLKGAASALYGQMPPGGLLNLVSKRPTSEPLREIELTLGTEAQKEAALDLSGPIDAEGKFGYRLTGLVRDSETFIDFTHDDRFFIAPVLTWNPSEKTWITLLLRHQEADTNAAAAFLPVQGTLNANPHGEIPVERYIGEPGFDRYEKELSSAGYEIEHRLNDTWRFQQNARIATAKVDHRLVSGLGLDPNDLRTLSRYAYTPREDSDVTAIDNQAEASFATGAARHKLLVGVDYRRGETDTASGFGAASPIDVFTPQYGAPVAVPADSFHVVQTQEHAGVYAQDQLRLERWALTLGGRHERVKTETRDVLAATEADQSDSRFSARAGVNYLFDSGFAPYAGWSTSFQPTIGTDFQGRAFKPTEGELFEVGVKYQPAGSANLVTVAVYESTLENTLTVDPDHLFFSLQQGKTRVRGAELEGRLSLTAGLNLIAAYAYTDARVVETTDPAADERRVPLVPRQQASLWLDYSFGAGRFEGLGFGAGVRYSGENYGDAYNVWRTPSFTVVDAMARYDLGRWRFQVNVSNAFDKRYVSAALSEIWAFYGQPRSVTLSTRYRW